MGLTANGFQRQQPPAALGCAHHGCSPREGSCVECKRDLADCVEGPGLGGVGRVGLTRFDRSTATCTGVQQ